MRHGTVYAYRKLKCRCAECRAASTAKTMRTRKRLRGRTVANDGIAPVTSHGLSTATNWGCRCRVCVDAQAKRNQDAGVNPSVRTRQMRKRVAQRHQDASLISAARNGELWTGPELEVAARRELTSRRAAELLGRTVFAVRTIRRRIESGDPRIDRLLGKPTKGISHEL